MLLSALKMGFANVFEEESALNMSSKMSIIGFGE